MLNFYLVTIGLSTLQRHLVRTVIKFGILSLDTEPTTDSVIKYSTKEFFFKKKKINTVLNFSEDGFRIFAEGYGEYY